MDVLLATLLVSLGLGAVGLVLAYSFRSDFVTNFFYALTVMAIAGWGFLASGRQAPHWLILLLVVIWAWRLSRYLLARSKVLGNDRRFDSLRDSFSKLSLFFLLQAMAAWAVSLPLTIFFGVENTRITAGILAGGAISIVGIIIESMADQQKFRHMRDGNSERGWLNSGLWKYSRHPNYFGEIMMWVGVYVSVTPWLDRSSTYLALLGPLTIIILLVFVTGLPPLEASASKKWGKDKKYQRYRETTSILIPMPPRKT